MTKTEITEQELADMGVRIAVYPPLRRKAIASAEGLVVLGELADSREKRTVLEHEKQHFRLRAFYTHQAGVQEQRRSEARVNKEMIFDLCPAEQLETLLRRGFTLPEIAEELEVTEELVTEAYAFYRARDPKAFRGKE